LTQITNRKPKPKSKIKSNLKKKNTKTQKRISKNIQLEPNNVDFKSNKIRTNQRHKHVGNYAKINNLAFMHFNYHSKITIFSKWVSVQNQNPRIKNY
jgi:hypothetical protein